MRTFAPSLRTKFLIGTIAIIAIVGISSIVIIRAALHRNLQQLVERNGSLIASHVALHSVSPLLTEQYIDLDLMSRGLMEEAGGDIRYTFFLDRHGAVVSHTFRRGFPSELKNANPLPPSGKVSHRHLFLDQEEVVDIGVPLLKGELGELHMGFSAKNVNDEIGRILRIVTLIILAVLLVGVALAVLFDAWVVRPVRDLTEAVSAAGAGDMSARVTVRSGDELGRLARSFNDALDRRQKAEADREAVIVKLQESLATVKQLSGMLPICASCKKVRDDKGYWSQIEAYISEHSEAEFSHGLCPDCAGRLYPDYKKRLP